MVGDDGMTEIFQLFCARSNFHPDLLLTRMWRRGRRLSRSPASAMMDPKLKEIGPILTLECIRFKYSPIDVLILMHAVTSSQILVQLLQAFEKQDGQVPNLFGLL
ncbi:hypothetical protein OPV22_023297 [Ensete ventricosum]|uniref:Uncharacterized protein n=1 Tax=Ensete ventricosum TaxID=4639 RepID=A0AAV8PCN8_ENSVE|nr:hypothetical protein OPV22_023297 [Ensete ventricosum]